LKKTDYKPDEQGQKPIPEPTVYIYIAISLYWTNIHMNTLDLHQCTNISKRYHPRMRLHHLLGSLSASNHPMSLRLSITSNNRRLKPPDVSEMTASEKQADRVTGT
jgi:hypothetical protein